MKRIYLVFGASFAAFALDACSHKDNSDAAGNSAGASMAALNDRNAAAPSAADQNGQVAALAPGQTFANQAAASDAFEIATSKLALDKAGKPADKKFARQMITAHTASTAKLKTVSGGLSPAITPDPTLTAEQQQALTDLQTKTGADFDTAYKAAQIDGHQKTLDALKAYAASGDVPDLKAFASGLVPTVTAHLNMAKAL